MTQKKFLSHLLKQNKNAVFIASLGTISYDLHDSNAYCFKGAMGCVIGIGLGFALNTKKKVIVVIGDGSLLMKMGSLSTVLKYKPKNLKIIVLDNGKYASTGGQEINFKYIRKYLPPNVKVVKVS